jgi:chemotaxis response regulator CheB
MPQSAIDLFAPDRVLPADQIAAAICHHMKGPSRAA